MAEKEIIYRPEGVCSKYIKVKVEEKEGNKGDNAILETTFLGGCPGNALGLSIAIKNKAVKEVIDMFKNVECGAKGTSCPAQLAKALEEYVNN